MTVVPVPIVYAMQLSWLVSSDYSIRDAQYDTPFSHIIANIAQAH